MSSDDRLEEFLKNVDLRFSEPFYELHALAEYLKTITTQVAAIEAELPDHLAARIEDAYRTEDFAEISVVGQEIFDIQENILPRHYLNSACLAVFSVFESCAISVARSTQSFSGSKLSIDDLGSLPLIDRLRKYFDVVLDIPFCSDNTANERILALLTVRNCLIHAGAQVRLTSPGQKKKLEALLGNKGRGLALTSHDDALMVREKFLTDSFAAVDSCIRQLIKDAKLALDAKEARSRVSAP